MAPLGPMQGIFFVLVFVIGRQAQLARAQCNLGAHMFFGPSSCPWLLLEVGTQRGTLATKTTSDSLASNTKSLYWVAGVLLSDTAWGVTTIEDISSIAPVPEPPNSHTSIQSSQSATQYEVQVLVKHWDGSKLCIKPLAPLQTACATGQPLGGPVQQIADTASTLYNDPEISAEDGICLITSGAGEPSQQASTSTS